jgi:enamine deaminase RidA (YjgF/YER057c/UK114 family)
MAAATASGFSVERVKADLNAPQSSGYAPCVRVGDMVFVAGQLARDASGDIAAKAKQPPGQQWNGTRIKLETEYLFNQRLLPALEAAGSSPDCVLKAQVYLSHAEDLPAFLQTWAQCFGNRIPPTTIVPVTHPAFGTIDATIEINLIAAHASARTRMRDIACDVELIAEGALQACSFDGLLFVSGLMAIDKAGLVAAAHTRASAPYFHDSTRAQMADILAKATTIFTAAGTDLSNVVRSLHFHTDLAGFHGAYMAWDADLREAGLPFSAVGVAPTMFVPGASLLVDLWGCAPGQ